MIDITGLTPIGVRCLDHDTRLQWRIGDRVEETGFDRFLPGQIRRLPKSQDLRVVWRDFADLPLFEPFHRGAVEKAIALEKKAELFETDWDVLVNVANSAETIPLSGIVFHMARTGSTLIHRLLGRSGIVHAVSENGQFDRVLSLTERWPRVDRDDALGAIMRVIGRPRRPSDRHFVFKMTDATPNSRLPMITSAFPQTPWIFVYRDPVEVMVSILRKPTGTVSGWFRNRAMIAQRLAMPALADAAMWPEEFVARTLRRFCMKAVEAARAAPEGQCLVVPYNRLPDAVWETIAPHFGITLTDKQREAMRAEAGYSSKRRDSSTFEPDSAGKQEQASPRVRELARRLVMPVIEELRQLPQG